MRYWRNPEDYSFTEKLDLAGWAWEFLRRNRTYREEFDAEVTKLQQFGYPEECSPPTTLDPEDPEFCIPCRSHEEINRWGIVAWFNPDHEKPSGPLFIPANLGVGLLHLGGPLVTPLDGIKEWRHLELNLAPSRIATQFNLSRPLKPQFEWAFNYIKWHQDWLKRIGVLEIRRPTLPGDNWLLYLQLLDAKDDGATTWEMGVTLLPQLYKGIEPKPARRVKRNRALMANQERRAQKRSKALAAVRYRLRQALRWTEPARYLEIAGRDL